MAIHRWAAELSSDETASRCWDHHNGASRTYGHDCTNFIAQAMLEGGWGPKGGANMQRITNKHWFYGPPKLTTSYTWAAPRTGSRCTPSPTYHPGDTHNKGLNKLLSDHPRTWCNAHRT